MGRGKELGKNRKVVTEKVQTVNVNEAKRGKRKGRDA
jgi:hypothetical protein